MVGINDSESNPNSITATKKKYEQQIAELRFNSLLEQLFFIFDKDKKFFQEQLRVKGLPENFESFVDSVFRRRYAARHDQFTSVRRDLKNKDPNHNVQELHPLIDSDQRSLITSLSAESLDEYIKAVKMIIDNPKEGLFKKILRFLGIESNKLGEIREYCRKRTENLEQAINQMYDSSRLKRLPPAITAYKPPSADQLIAKQKHEAARSELHKLPEVWEARYDKILNEEESSRQRLVMAMKLQTFVSSKGDPVQLESFNDVNKMLEYCHKMLLDSANKVKQELLDIYLDQSSPAKDEQEADRKQALDLLTEILGPVDLIFQPPLYSREEGPDNVLAELMYLDSTLKQAKDLLQKIKKQEEDRKIKLFINAKWQSAKAKIPSLLKVLQNEGAKLASYSDLNNQNKKRNIELYITLLNDIQIRGKSSLGFFLDFLNQAIDEGTLHRIVAEDRETKARDPEYISLIQLRDDLIKFDQENPGYLAQISKHKSQDVVKYRKQEDSKPHYQDAQRGDWPDALEPYKPRKIGKNQKPKYDPKH